PMPEQLSAQAHAVVQSMPGRDVGEAGFTSRTLLEQNVGLVVTSISCFGATGPYAKYNANDLTLMAMGGWMSPQGDAGEAPLYAGEPLLSYLTGEHAAL